MLGLPSAHKRSLSRCSKWKIPIEWDMHCQNNLQVQNLQCLYYSAFCGRDWHFYYVNTARRGERWHPVDSSVETVCVLSWGHHHRASSTDGETAAEAHFIHPSPARAVSFSSLLVYTFHNRSSSLLLWFLLISRPLYSPSPSLLFSLSHFLSISTSRFWHAMHPCVCARLYRHITTQNRALRAPPAYRKFATSLSMELPPAEINGNRENPRTIPAWEKIRKPIKQC
jgi:hypothetical protein